MNLLTRRTVPLLALFVAACSHLVVVDTATPASIQSELAAGDRIMLTTEDGGFFEVTVDELTDVAIEAHDGDGQLVSIAYEDVARVSMRQRRPGRTAAAVAGGIGMTVVVLSALAGLAAAVILGGGF